MTLTQILEDGAARANELFARLSDSKPGAAKQRDKLLAELEAEIEAVRRLDEEHLFPVLANDAATRGLVQLAKADQALVRDLIGQIKQMPKDGEAFLGKVTDLRQAFQRSLRDERKELLPAIRGALGAVDAERLALRMADGREQEKQGALRRQAEEGQENARRQALEQARERLTAQAGSLLGRAAEGTAAVAGQARDGAAQGFGVATHLPKVAAEALGETTRVLSDLTSRTVESGQRATREIARCGTPLQAAVIQARLVREMAEVWMDTGSRMMEISMRASQDAILPPTRQQD